MDKRWLNKVTPKVDALHEHIRWLGDLLETLLDRFDNYQKITQNYQKITNYQLLERVNMGKVIGNYQVITR